MNFFRRHKYLFLSIIVLSCFVLMKPVYANVGEAAAGLVANLLVLVVDILGKVLVVLMHILIWICSYNDFVSSLAVTNGWIILRDVCNMFFILILLVIAFATVLNIEGYSWKKLLPKMLLMAVLINFSKLICGVIIDFAQVIMLTFVNGFRDIGGGNLAAMLGIPDLLSINSDAVTPVNMLSIAGTYLLALAYVIVSIGVIVIILFVLVMRMVMLWILVTLSPLAYLLGALPNTSKYASKWWSQFTENVVSGPILAFFIWLSFASATYDVGSHAQKPNGGNVNEVEQKYLDATAGLSKSGSPDGMLKFIISIGMLIGGVIITKDLGGAAAKAVSQGMSVNNWARKKTTNAAKEVGKTTAQVGLRTAGGLTTLTGQGISKLSGGYLGEATQKRGQFMSGWGKDIQKTQKDAATAKKLKTLNKFGIKEQGLKGLQEYEKSSFGGKMTAAALSGSPMEMYQAAVVRTWPMKWMGGKLKDFSTKYQESTVKKRTEKNVDKTTKVVEELQQKKDKEKANMYEENIHKRDKDISSAKDYRDDNIGAINLHEKESVSEEIARYNEQKRLAEIRGANPTAMSLLEQEHKQNLDDIHGYADRRRVDTHLNHDKDVKDINYRYGTDAANQKTRIDLAYRTDLNNAQEYSRKAKEESRRSKEIDSSKSEKTERLSKNEADRSEALTKAKELFKSAPDARDAEVRRLNTEYDQKAKEIEQKHQEKSKDINENYKNALPVNAAPTIVTKLTDKAGNALEQYDPLELTNAAIKKGLEAMRHAAEIFGAIGLKKIGDLGKASFSRGARGNDETTTRVWKMLAKGDAEAKNKLTQMIDELREIGDRADGPTDAEKKVIQGMKEGLGVFLRDNPGEKSTFTVFIENLDKVDTGKKVDDYTVGKGGHEKKEEKNKDKPSDEH